MNDSSAHMQQSYHTAPRIAPPASTSFPSTQWPFFTHNTSYVSPNGCNTHFEQHRGTLCEQDASGSDTDSTYSTTPFARSRHSSQVESIPGSEAIEILDMLFGTLQRPSDERIPLRDRELPSSLFVHPTSILRSRSLSTTSTTSAQEASDRFVGFPRRSASTTSQPHPAWPSSIRRASTVTSAECPSRVLVTRKARSRALAEPYLTAMNSTSTSRSAPKRRHSSKDRLSQQPSSPARSISVHAIDTMLHLPPYSHSVSVSADMEPSQLSDTPISDASFTLLVNQLVNDTEDTFYEDSLQNGFVQSSLEHEIHGIGASHNFDDPFFDTEEDAEGMLPMQAGSFLNELYSWDHQTRTMLTSQAPSKFYPFDFLPTSLV